MKTQLDTESTINAKAISEFLLKTITQDEADKGIVDDGLLSIGISGSGNEKPVITGEFPFGLRKTDRGEFI